LNLENAFSLSLEVKMAERFRNDRPDGDYLEQVRDLVLRAAFNLDCTVFLFGSRASGVARRSSDIDIGISGLSESEFIRLRDELMAELEESVIPHRVDLVNMDTVTGPFRDVAMKKVIIWKQKSRAS